MAISSMSVRAGMAAQKRMASATSEAPIMVARSSAVGGRGRSASSGVSTSPGRIVQARMPRLRNSAFTLPMKLSNAALDAA